MLCFACTTTLPYPPSPYLLRPLLLPLILLLQQTPWFGLDKVYFSQLATSGICLVLTFYLANVLPNEFGAARNKPWFIFDPLYWLNSKRSRDTIHPKVGVWVRAWLSAPSQYPILHVRMVVSLLFFDKNKVHVNLCIFPFSNKYSKVTSAYT